jgi:sugar lactone lactonase YvrE
MTRPTVFRIGCPVAAVALALPALAAGAAGGPGRIIDFESERWVRTDADVVEHLGRTALVGSAHLPDAGFRNGIIEFDLALDGSPGYPGIAFRASSPTSYEHVYVRPHAGLRKDGLQYAPAFGPGSDWQLYNGDGFTAAVRMPANEWIHVRIEVLERQARVFFGNPDEPALVIDELRHEPAPGAVAIRSRRDASAHFSDFRITKTDDLDLGPAPRPSPPRGLVTEWEISQPFKAADVQRRVYPDAALQERIAWGRVPTEPGGLLNLSRHVTRSTNGESDLVFARVFLDSDRAETRRFSFGYSDLVTVFLNGRPVFTGNAAYRSRSPDYAGIVSLEDALFLPLREGRNELLFAVVETFGGWGLIAQDNSADFVHPDLRRLWSLEAGNRLPEAVVHDPARGVLYVSQYFRGGQEVVSRIALDGRVLEREWVAGLDRPTGLWVHGGRLWVVERRSLAEIDLDTAEIVGRHPIPEPGFPNDVTFDDRGDGYVTDTSGNRIYRFHDGRVEVWFENPELGHPNGILADGASLLFGTSDDGRLRRLSLDDRAIDTVAVIGDGANVDGVRHDGRGGYLVSDFGGRVLRVTPQGRVTEILNTTASGARSADFEYVSEDRLLVVPGLFDNRLTAYRLDGP